MHRDYLPLDLSRFGNLTVTQYQERAEQGTGSYLEERTAPPVGRQTLRGLPFHIGTGAGGPDLIAPHLLPDHAVREVPIGQAVHGVVFAHVLLDSELWSGAPFGRRVARYRLCTADGQAHEVPIRERMEIGHIPLPWGQYPLLCVPDRHDVMEDQRHGQFERAGFRQTEVQPSSPAAYYLWYWANPQPDVVIDTLTIEAEHPGLVVAGVTLGFIAEDPVRPRTRLTARVRIAAEADVTSPPRIVVDRGVAGYPQALPDQPLDASGMGYPGWGAPDADGSAGYYVDIAAAPSATVSVADDAGRFAADVRWADVLRHGSAQSGPVHVDLIDTGRNWMKITIVDEGTGRAVPCRVAFQTPDGVPFAPHGHHAHVYSGLQNWNIDVGGDVRLGQVTYAYVDGAAEGWLPRGPLIVDVARGFEYEPVRVRTTIVPGQRELRLSIRRWVDMNARGWYSGDTHVHFLSGQGSLLEAAGEDLNVVNLLQSQWGHLFTSTEEFTGGPMWTADHRHVVWVSQENREHILGHLGLLGLKRPVMPWATGGPGEGELGGGLETTESRWADAAHEQGATVVLAHFPTPNAEAPVMVATGRADAVEMYDQLDFEHLEYYRYLDDGYRLPLVAGTDKMASGVPVGLYRTYAQLESGVEFTFETWTAAVRAGRTFITSGPMIELSVNGQPVGTTLHVSAGDVLEVECNASSVLPMHTLQLIERGRVVGEVSVDDQSAAGSTAPAGPVRTLRLRTTLPVTGPTWLAARCGGPDYQPLRHHDEQRRGIMAHTSPVYVAIDEHYRLRDPRTSDYMLSVIAAAREYLRAGSPQYPDGTVSHHHGRADHLAFLEEPFLEAERRIIGRGQ